jgi:hypothetical protein
LALNITIVGDELPGIPGIPPQTYVTPVRGKRNIKPKRDPDFQTKNIVEDLARNNSRCFTMPPLPGTKTAQSPVYKNSFFPRTLREWNALDDNTVTAKSNEAFKNRLSTLGNLNDWYNRSALRK